MTTHISVSIVVHQQADLVCNLLQDLNTLHDVRLETLLTFNIPETAAFGDGDFQFPLTLIRNREPRGFGANHNAAFRRIRGRYFCVVNPDIRLREDPFEKLMEMLEDPQTAVAAPAIRNTQGHQEDNIRHFPTPVSILAKSLGFWPRIEYPQSRHPFDCEWVAGMFMLFKPGLFSEVGGFDERYHLYYEDVDICARLKIAGYRVVACPNVSVVHSARRESHQNLRYLKWHLRSMLRFFLSRTYRRARALDAASLGGE